MFTSDFFTQNIGNWSKWLAAFCNRPIRALEIGSFEGRSAYWLAENILTHPQARLVCIDTFKGGQDMTEFDDSIYMRFLENVKPWGNKIEVHMGRSGDVLPKITGLFDIAYIDGSHYADDVYQDAMMVWPMMNEGGLVIFDDYGWVLDPDPTRRPKPGIDRFLSNQSGKYQLIDKGWQVAIRKRPLPIWRRLFHN
jgi:predicted O-methyltransferase YrrM